MSGELRSSEPLLQGSAGGDTSWEAMGSSAPDPLALPARNPGGRTPRSPGFPLGLPRDSSRPQGFLNSSLARVGARGSDNPRGSPPRSPGQHSTGQTSPRPTTSGTLPAGPATQALSAASASARPKKVVRLSSPEPSSPAESRVPWPENNCRQAPPHSADPALRPPRL